MPERIVIRNTQSPGDFTVMSAAIRDLSIAHPGRFEFYVDVPQMAVYQANPWIKGFGRGGANGRQVVGQYPAIHKSNQRKGIHFLWGFIEDLNQKLKANAVLTDFRPDLHLTDLEKAEAPCGVKKPYWVFVSGGKKDYTAKWWAPQSWQDVVNTMVAKGHTMVQVGGGSHVHPPIKNVVDLYNKTSFRELMRLIYHSDGVMCIVTCLAHIAAAFNKPCVVVAGGREANWWEAYDIPNRLSNMRKGQPQWTPPNPDNFVPHRYLHTIGLLDCCKTGGCWKSRIEPGGPSVCSKPVKHGSVTIPKCMQMITPELVVEAAESYYLEGVIEKPSGLVVPAPVTLPRTTRPPIYSIRTEDESKVKEAFTIPGVRWIVWTDDRYPAVRSDTWLDEAIKRLEQRDAAAGGMYLWELVDGKKIWRLRPGVIILNREKINQVGVPENLADLGNVLKQKQMVVVNIGDLIRYL